MNNLRAILIGGTSNVGKSTVAQALAAKLGWHYITTDHLARHPGRPWKTPERAVPPHVAEHYLTLPLDELIVDVLAHYKRLWPTITDLITHHVTDSEADCLVMEGSALWPESVATLSVDQVDAVWLTADDALFQNRIYANSNYTQTTGDARKMIDKFVQRTHLYNQQMMAAIQRLGLASITITESDTAPEVLDKCLTHFRGEL